MKPHIIVAVAGTVIINSLGFGRADKKNDPFSKADMKFLKTHEKKCNDTVSNCKGKHWHSCKAVV